MRFYKNRTDLGGTRQKIVVSGKIKLVLLPPFDIEMVTSQSLRNTEMANSHAPDSRSHDGYILIRFSRSDSD